MCVSQSYCISFRLRTRNDIILSAHDCIGEHPLVPHYAATIHAVCSTSSPRLRAKPIIIPRVDFFTLQGETAGNKCSHRAHIFHLSERQKHDTVAFFKKWKTRNAEKFKPHQAAAILHVSQLSLGG